MKIIKREDYNKLPVFSERYKMLNLNQLFRITDKEESRHYVSYIEVKKLNELEKNKKEVTYSLGICKLI